MATSPSSSVDRSPAARTLDLFEAYGDAAYRLAVLMLGRPDAAEDIVQETFLKLLEHVTSGRPLDNPRGWIFTVAAHACRDRQRASRRWLAWLADRDVRIAPERPDANDGLDRVLRALRGLSPRDRHLVALRAGGLTYAEIASAAGVQPVSTGRLLARALDRLARHLDEGPEP